MQTSNGQTPVGTMKKLVSLVDRGAFDNIVYPQSERSTLFQPNFKPYHNFVSDIAIWPFSGVAEWGKRITFAVPFPWETDMLSWIALRIKPLHWLSPEVYRKLYVTKEWIFANPKEEWVWTQSLGSAAIERAEMEVDGVIVEQWSGDWIRTWSRTALDINEGIGWDDSVLGALRGTEDGFVYCYLPFWFAKYTNTSFPLISTDKPVRFHITLRPFNQLVRMANANKIDCDEIPLAKIIKIRDMTFPFIKYRDILVGNAVPTMEAADLVCGTAHIDGELRKAYRDQTHEIMMNPVQEIQFSEPLKYVVGVANGNRINIGLPLSQANGPIRQIIWFLRRKAAVDLRADWTNFSAILEEEENEIWNPKRPLLKRAQLMIGTAVWADQEESWWRATGALPLKGGIRTYADYIYAYNFTDKPDSFNPGGSVNASRVDIRLNLEVEQPTSEINNEWEVVVFLVGTNWMRFQNSIAGLLFMD
jgi:hypothetical protein